MRSASEYLEDKLEEINYLRDGLGLPFLSSENMKESEDFLIQEKYRIRANYHRSFLDDHVMLSETNFSTKKRYQRGGFKFETLYQRFDLKVLFNNPLTELYDIDFLHSKSVGMFTTSGMGSISSLLMGLKSGLEGEWGIYAENDSYFETIHLIKNYFPEISIGCSEWKKSWNFGVFWYDSISKYNFNEVYKKISDKNIKLIVVDTTCYSLDDCRLEEILETASSLGVPCALVRSHIKLDSLALEYGRLGSLVFNFKADMSEDILSLVQQVSIHSKNACSRLGLNFNPESLFPLQNDKEFHRLNKRRLLHIEENTKNLTSLLRSSLVNTDLGVYTYHHNLFLTIEFEESLFRSEIDIQKSIVRELLNLNGLNVKEAGSFGFDFHAIDSYKDCESGKDRIRFSPSDGPIDEIELIAKLIANYLKKDKDV